MLEITTARACDPVGDKRLRYPFRLRSAHRFFIASESRFLPSGVSRPRRLRF
jgi:hypothetical protein